jgi:RNA polymerase sigma-70 factor (ECF subfamily)
VADDNARDKASDNAHDDELVAAAQSGNRSSLEELLRRHYDRVYAVCRRVTGDENDAADAAQEAMIAVVRGLARFDGRSSFSTWVYRIATNASVDELRRRRRRPLTTIETNADQVPTELIDPDAGVRIDSTADRMALDRALADLPEDFRVAVVLRDVGDLDYTEIAEVLGIPAGTVKSRIARGRAALASALGRQFGNQATGSERQTNTP